MTTIDATVAEQALRALEEAHKVLSSSILLEDAITALRTALTAAGGDAKDATQKFTTGHCENHKVKGGCQLHNLQCGYPNCDRRAAKLERLQ